jgi:hypothetical protein
VQLKALKDGKPIDKPIYNHVTGLIDPPEKIMPNKVGTQQQPSQPQPAAVARIAAAQQSRRQARKWAFLGQGSHAHTPSRAVQKRTAADA